MFGAGGDFSLVDAQGNALSDSDFPQVQHGVDYQDDRILLYVTDGDITLAGVRALGLEPLTSLVRRSTLEDVFLRLTGRRLGD